MAHTSLAGRVFGKLTVTKLAYRENGKIYYECKCKCGNTKNIASTNLTKKVKPQTSCGCSKFNNPKRLKSVLGQTFDRLTVTKELPTVPGELHRRCLCKCSCGTKNFNTLVYNLTNGKTFSCGCISKEKRDKVQPGMVFGRLTVIKFHKLKRLPKSTWKCICKCGNKIETTATFLTTGNTQSCGCLRKDLLTVHGHALNNDHSRTYTTWGAMKARCYNKKHKFYKNYGGKGVTICQRWLNSFSLFLQDMGKRPKGKTIDRIDPFGNYEPDNCRWAGKYTQGSNKRYNVEIMYKGKLTTLARACRKEKVKYMFAYNRLIKGWKDKDLFNSKKLG